MSFLHNLINPPPTKGNLDDHYKFFNSVNTSLQGLTSVRNASVLTNPDFSTLSAKGLTPTTQADADGTEFIGSFKVVGRTAGTYAITPTAYPTNSTVKSSSPYYVHVVINSFNGAPFYFYQNQPGTVRQYQNDSLTFGFSIKNNQAQQIKVMASIVSNYGSTQSVKNGSTFFLQPGMNSITSTIQTDSLQNVTVTGGNYTQFQFNFIDLVNGTADLEFYLIKCEYGKISTPH